MLPASTSNASPARLDASPHRAGRAATGALRPWQIGLTAGLVLYALAVVGGLVAGVVRPERAYLLLAVPCLLPMSWCAYGYFKADQERDSGLLLAAAGWLLLALAFISKQIAVASAGADAYALDATSPFVSIFAAFGILSLLVSVVFAILFWVSNEEDDQPPASMHY